MCHYTLTLKHGVKVWTGCKWLRTGTDVVPPVIPDSLESEEFLD